MSAYPSAAPAGQAPAACVNVSYTPHVLSRRAAAGAEGGSHGPLGAEGGSHGPLPTCRPCGVTQDSWFYVYEDAQTVDACDSMTCHTPRVLAIARLECLR